VQQMNAAFIKVTEELQGSVAGMFSQLKEGPSTAIFYYKVWTSVF
jgi:hypothetical protein